MSKVKAIPQPEPQSTILPPDLKDEIRRFIIDLRTDLEGEPGKPFQFGTGAFFGNDQDGYISLSGNMNKRYYLLLNRVFDFLCNTGRFSKSIAQKLLNKVILEALDIGSHQSDDHNVDLSITKAFTQLDQFLGDGFKQYQVFYPICGLALDGLPLHFGEIEFVLLDARFLNNVSPILYESIREHENFLAPYASVFVETYDDEMARQMARKIIRAHLDIINFFSDLVPYHNGCFLFLSGEAQSTSTMSFVRRKDPDREMGIGVSFNVTGPSHLSLSNIVDGDDKYHFGLIRVMDVMGNSRSELQEALLLALRWAGMASVSIVQGHKSNAVLKFITALETILLPEQARRKTKTLSTRVAALLAIGGADPQGVYKEFKKLYDSRCNVVHAGFIDDIDDASLERLRYIAKYCLLTLLNREPFCSMSRCDELEDWFNRNELVRSLVKQ